MSELNRLSDGSNVVVHVPSVATIPEESGAEGKQPGDGNGGGSFFLSEATFQEKSTQNVGPQSSDILLAPKSNTDASPSASHESLTSWGASTYAKETDTARSQADSTSMVRVTDSTATLASDMTGTTTTSAGGRKRVRQFTIGGGTPFAKGGDTQQRRLYRSILKKPGNLRTQQDLRMIKSLLKNMEVFQGLPDDIILQLGRCVGHEFAKRRATVARVGEKASKLHVILVGTVLMTEPIGGSSSPMKREGTQKSLSASVEDIASLGRSREASSVTLVGDDNTAEETSLVIDPVIAELLKAQKMEAKLQLGAGDTIGALNLLRSAPMTQSAVIQEDTEFLVLSKKDYDRTLKVQAEETLQKKIDYLSSLPAFSRSTRGFIVQVAQSLVSKTCPRNTVLAQQDRAIDKVLFLVAGECRLTMTVSTLKQHKFPLQHSTRDSVTLDVATVGAGELVGAAEVLQDHPYSSTVTASTTVEYLEISASEFVSKLGVETRLEVIRVTDPKMERRQERCMQLLQMTEKKVIQPVRNTYLGERLKFPSALVQRDQNEFFISPRLSKQIYASFQASPHTSLRERAEARIHGKALSSGKVLAPQPPGILKPVSRRSGSRDVKKSQTQVDHVDSAGDARPRTGTSSITVLPDAAVSRKGPPRSSGVSFVTEVPGDEDPFPPGPDRLTSTRRSSRATFVSFGDNMEDTTSQGPDADAYLVDWEGPAARNGGNAGWDFTPQPVVPRSVPKTSRSYRSLRQEKAQRRLIHRQEAAQEATNARNLARTRVTKVLLADALSRTGNFRIRDHMSPDAEGVILQPGAARIGRRKAGSTNAATLAEFQTLFAKPRPNSMRKGDGTARLMPLKRIGTEKLLLT